MKNFAHRIIDVRYLWFWAPLWGNLIFLPALLMSFAPRAVQPRSSFLWVYCTLAIAFFSYFLVRAVFALPDPGFEGAISRILPVPIIALILWFCPPDISRSFWVPSIALAAIAVFVVGMLEWIIGGSDRVRLLAGNTLLLAAATVPLCYLNAFFSFRAKNRRLRLLHYIGLFAALLVVALLSGSRSSTIIALCALAIHICAVWIFPPQFTYRHRRVHTFIIILIAILAVAIASNFGPSAARMSEFALNALEASRSNQRIEMWSGAYAAMMDAPIFGYGPQNRWAALEGYVASDLYQIGYSHPHNLFFNLGLAGGVVGIVAGFSYILLPSIFALWSGKFLPADKELFVQGTATILAAGIGNLVLFEGFIAVITTLTLIGAYYILSGPHDNRYSR